MENKVYKIAITEHKELNGGVIFDQWVTEEQFLQIVQFLNKQELHSEWLELDE